jgi:eukaryotic-like serine/threonine-protein kinase
MNCPVCNHSNVESSRFCAHCGALLGQPAGEGRGLIGQVLGGRYVVNRVIGEGGMGVVYEAEQRLGAHTRKVAIKTLHPALSRDRIQVSRFFRECGVVAQLEHPNTVRIYDFGEGPEQTLYIAMEFVHGRRLSDVIEQGPMPLDRVKNVVRQVCGALQEAHGFGIIHRDLKPDNIVLSERSSEPDFVKLLDFGIATHVGLDAATQTKLTQQGVVLGTPPYMSPEQLAGKPLDARSDVYSLAVICYEMLTGRLPFEADSAVEWARKHLTEQPRAMHTVVDRAIASEAEGAVMRALSKDPAARQATANEFYRELAAAEAGTPQGKWVPTANDLLAEKTEGMRASPFGQPAPERTAAGPLYPPHMGSPPVGPHYGTGAAVIAQIPSPPSRRSSGLGWVIGILSLLALSGVAVAGVIAVQQGLFAFGSPSDPRPAMPTVTASNQTEVAPLVTAPPSPPVLPTTPSEPEPMPAPKPATPSKPTPKPAATPKPTAPPPATSPQPTTPAPTTPPPATTPPPQPQPQPTQPPPTSGPTGDAACQAARNAARGRNIEGAVGLYRRCESTGGSPTALEGARAHIKNNAPSAVRERALADNCAGARSAVSSANSIGAGGPAQAEYKSSSCAGR